MYVSLMQPPSPEGVIRLIAAKCRAVAVGTTDRKLAAEMLKMAEEFEQMVLALPPARPFMTC